MQSDVDVSIHVASDLGVSPDSRVKVLVCVEGQTDIIALKALSAALHQNDPTLPNLSDNNQVAFVVLGGGNLKHWVNYDYLKHLGRPEIHIYDSDVPSYAPSIDAINARNDGSKGFLTQKYEIESYLHSDAIFEAFGIRMTVPDHLNSEGKATPKIFAEMYSVQQNYDGIMKDNNAKIRLAESAFPLMTHAMIQERDPTGEVTGWLREISYHLD